MEKKIEKYSTVNNVSFVSCKRNNPRIEGKFSKLRTLECHFLLNIGYKKWEIIERNCKEEPDNDPKEM
jgi:hypothetical protein